MSSRQPAGLFDNFVELAQRQILDPHLVASGVLSGTQPGRFDTGQFQAPNLRMKHLDGRSGHDAVKLLGARPIRFTETQLDPKMDLARRSLTFGSASSLLCTA